MNDPIRETLRRLCTRGLAEFLELAPAAVTKDAVTAAMTTPAKLYLDTTVTDRAKRARLGRMLQEIAAEVFAAAIAAGTVVLSSKPVSVEDIKAGGLQATLSAEFREELHHVCRTAMDAILTSGRLRYTTDQVLDLMVIAAGHLVASKTNDPAERLRLMSGCQEAALAAMQEASLRGKTAFVRN
ncbi:hypothetical protein [Urbifossiella limnaea]|uniref:Uncharacterized protein n=1 Tax=Urbifossiella limnaea TaxID=2528023 RepID=A0A517XPR9_9BACT|nr:hypothetical protein [Urbifossiella limnaea]QDU19486.1 hypothetical protein ETAA1_14130 [Urbifossiella limnaea]